MPIGYNESQKQTSTNSVKVGQTFKHNDGYTNGIYKVISISGDKVIIEQLNPQWAGDHKQTVSLSFVEKKQRT